VARLVVEGLQQKYPGSAFLVENKPGASGNLGTDAVAKAAPDGSTLGVSIGGPLAINILLFSRLPYDPRKDIAPVTQLVSQPSVLAVKPGAWGQLCCAADCGPENESRQIQFCFNRKWLAVASCHGSHRLEGWCTACARALRPPQAVTAVIRNDAQMACLPAISVTSQAAAGAVKILAVSTVRRSPYLPDVPTLKEAGVDVEADAWNGLIAPGNSPKLIIDAISRDVAEIIRQVEVREKLAAQLMESVGSSPKELRARMDGEIARWAPVIQAASVKLN